MKTLVFDSLGGASGDMVLGALIDLGADRDRLYAQLRALPVGAFELEAEPCCEQGLHGVRVTVTVGAGHHHGHTHEHRDLGAIRELITGSGLPDAVQQRSIAVFARLAEAEGRVHGQPPEKVTFHEVGAVDSIVDIVGACLALESLGIDEVAVGPLPLGHGSTQSQHGTIPIPAPATVALLEGSVVVQTDEPHELVTPTGAALLRTWRTRERGGVTGTIAGVGHGFGHRRLEARPNLLRACLFESAGQADQATPSACLMLECNIDDMVPELVGGLTDTLLAAGALDVFVTPVQMKKQRPGFLLSVPCRPADKQRLLDQIFRGSTTFGVRAYAVDRTVLARHHEVVQTAFGELRVKVGEWRGAPITRAPEYEDCVRLAEANNVSVRAVYEAAVQAATKPAS